MIIQRILDCMQLNVDFSNRISDQKSGIFLLPDDMWNFILAPTPSVDSLNSKRDQIKMFATLLSTCKLMYSKLENFLPRNVVNVCQKNLHGTHLSRLFVRKSTHFISCILKERRWTIPNYSPSPQ